MKLRHTVGTLVNNFLIRGAGGPIVENPEEFNRILHNARPDALEIQDIVQFYFVLLDRIEKHIASKSADAMVDAG